MPQIELRPLPPAEAIRFFRDKGFTVGFAWQDVSAQEHARAFTVAKATSLDLLSDIKGALDGAIAQGTTFRDFQERLTPVLQEKGWWGRKALIDPKTGEAKLVQLGSPRRLQTIFDVNVRVAYAAGSWERIQRVKARRPFLRYSAILDDVTRPQHRDWHGTVLPADDGWWSTHYPPNGWRCRCRAIQLNQRDLDRFGFKVTERAPARRTRPWLNKRTGEVVKVPVGIDPGWAHNVGKAAAARPVGGALDVLIEKMERAPAEFPRPVIEQLLTERLFRDHLGGKLKGDYPVAFLGQGPSAALGAKARVIRLSDATAAKQRRARPDLPADAYRLAQQVIDEGAARESGDRSLVFISRAQGQLWRAVVKRTRDGGELFLQTLHRSNEGQLRRHLRRLDSDR